MPSNRLRFAMSARRYYLLGYFTIQSTTRVTTAWWSDAQRGNPDQEQPMATRSRIGLFAFWTHALLACGGAATEASPATVTVHPEREVHAEAEVHAEMETGASPVAEAPVVAPAAAPLPEVLTEERSIDAIVAWSRDWLGSTRSEEELAIAEAEVPVFPSEPARCAWAEERFEDRKSVV